MRVAGIVVAAGRGERFGGAVAKQFRLLAGKSLVEHAVDLLAGNALVDGIVVVLPAADAVGPAGAEIEARPGVIGVVAGKDTRAGSVRAGLERARSSEYVLVHDAARPGASGALVERVLAATLADGAAVPVVAVPDTVKEDDGRGFSRRTVPRGDLRLAQTPQGARTDWLLEALDAAQRDGAEVTDEAMALERAGRAVRLVPGDERNRKITTEDDLALAARQLGDSDPGLRVGTGYDVHPFADGRALVLGGVSFPGERGLAGHSDADVVLHAAMDAVLGAAGLGDIGAHFPPDDATLKGADSAALAATVARMAHDAGFAIVNIDLTVLAERPRIRPRVDAMRAAVARAFGIAPARVGLKATTLEGLGSLGRAEGIGCQAAALLSRRGAP